MPLSLHIAEGNARRLAVGKDQRSYQPGLVCCGRIAAWDYYSNTKRGNQYMKPRRETRHHRPALEKQPITESPTMRSFVFNDITIPVAFKATCSRRAQLWNRQASIIMDLTTLALRHGWHSLPRV